MLFVCICIFLYIFSCTCNQNFQELKLSVPWPSGIQIDTLTDSRGRIYRFGRLQHNAINLRPHWSKIAGVNDVFSLQECIDIIKKAERHASRFGWSKGRHVDYDIRPTQDLPVEVIFQSEEELLDIHSQFTAKVWPAISSSFKLETSKIRLTDLFITKYNSSTKENFLGPHQDKSPWSFVIPLNSEFEGGGTYFVHDKSHWNPPAGAALYFSGAHLHGGSRISSGVRYILAGFCEYGEDFPLESHQAHSAFMSIYDPQYDGFAAQAGFRSGDQIIALETCDDLTTLDISSGAPATETCNSEQSSQYCENTPAGTAAAGFVRRKVEITEQTSAADWVRYAQACEVLDPGGDLVLWVRRGGAQKHSKD